MGLLSNILLIVLIAIFIILFYPRISLFTQLVESFISNELPGLGIGHKINFPNASQYNQSAQSINAEPTINYALFLINKDRSSYGLPNVTLSSTTSGEQHAGSMLINNYFSHWDIYGMKPYMRYARVGGRGAVQENIAYTKSGVQACIGTICTNYGNLNVTTALAHMEYNMIYNDSLCCNNGHRDNILDPNHNQVSIGIAYNSTTVYFVEDFINNYITWFNNTPSVNTANKVMLEGGIANNYKLSSVEVSYDLPVLNMSRDQLSHTGEYGYGTPVAGIVGNPLDYYPSLNTIVADSYYTQGNDFLVNFNMGKLIKDNGPGEYTVAIWLNGTTTNSSFVGATYTVFVNSTGIAYKPSNV
jgi:uncharacterized protein YkwD